VIIGSVFRRHIDEVEQRIIDIDGGLAIRVRPGSTVASSTLRKFLDAPPVREFHQPVIVAMHLWRRPRSVSQSSSVKREGCASATHRRGFRGSIMMKRPGCVTTGIGITIPIPGGTSARIRLGLRVGSMRISTRRTRYSGLIRWD
jgi:hypothetical protein